MKKKKNEGVHSKRAKGFALRLNLDHWFTVHQVYLWLKAQGETTSEMDEVIVLMPNPVKLTPEDFVAARNLGDVRKLRWPDLRGSRTFRVRAQHVEGTKQILRASGAFLIHGQAPTTLLRRADMLDEIETLDLLVDATR